MAVVAQVARVVITNATGTSNRTFTATAAAQDTDAGGSVVVTVTETTTGALFPAVADTESLNYYDDSGALIKTVALTPGSASQTDTFYFTANGLSGGAVRAGTVEIALRVTKTTGGPTATYDVESDGNPNTPPSTYTSTLDRGWIRAKTTATLATSNVNAGGAVPALFAYSDIQYQRLVTGAVFYVSRSFTVALGAIRSAATNSTVGPTFDVTHAAVGNAYPASSSAYAQTVTIGNSALTGLPFTVFTTTTAPSVQVDPRITRAPLFQLDDNTFGSPPLSKDVPNHIRQSTNQAFLATRITNANGIGLNGITFDVQLASVKPGTPITQTGQVTQTQGGQAGWSQQFLAWASSLPGGEWDKTAQVTAPATATGIGYLVLAAGSSDMYSLIAKDPNLDVRLNVQHQPAYGGRHFSAGINLIPTAYLLDTSTNVRIPTSQIGSASVSAVRAATAANSDGSGTKWEYLDATGTWVAWTAGTPSYFYPLSASSADSSTFERVFTTDATWGTRDIRFNITMVYNNVYYFNTYIVINVDAKNMHDGYAFDGGGFVGFPTR